MLKKMKLAVMALMMVMGLSIINPIETKAATTSNSFIVNVYDGGKNYSGRYVVSHDFGYYKGSVIGKTFTIQEVNVSSILSKSEQSFFNKYARFRVYLYKTNGQLYKYVGSLRNGGTFKLPSGTYKIVISSEIDSTGWNYFAQNTSNWSYAQYKLKY